MSSATEQLFADKASNMNVHSDEEEEQSVVSTSTSSSTEKPTSTTSKLLSFLGAGTKKVASGGSNDCPTCYTCITGEYCKCYPWQQLLKVQEHLNTGYKENRALQWSIQSTIAGHVIVYSTYQRGIDHALPFNEDKPVENKAVREYNKDKQGFLYTLFALNDEHIKQLNGKNIPGRIMKGWPLQPKPFYATGSYHWVYPFANELPPRHYLKSTTLQYSNGEDITHNQLVNRMLVGSQENNNNSGGNYGYIVSYPKPNTTATVALDEKVVIHAIYMTSQHTDFPIDYTCLFQHGFAVDTAIYSTTSLSAGENRDSKDIVVYDSSAAGVDGVIPVAHRGDYMTYRHFAYTSLRTALHSCIKKYDYHKGGGFNEVAPVEDVKYTEEQKNDIMSEKPSAQYSFEAKASHKKKKGKKGVTIDVTPHSIKKKGNNKKKGGTGTDADAITIIKLYAVPVIGCDHAHGLTVEQWFVQDRIESIRARIEVWIREQQIQHFMNTCTKQQKSVLHTLYKDCGVSELDQRSGVWTKHSLSLLFTHSLFKKNTEFIKSLFTGCMKEKHHKKITVTDCKIESDGHESCEIGSVEFDTPGVLHECCCSRTLPDGRKEKFCQIVTPDYPEIHALYKYMGSMIASAEKNEQGELVVKHVYWYPKDVVDAELNAVEKLYTANVLKLKDLAILLKPTNNHNAGLQEYTKKVATNTIDARKAITMDFTITVVYEPLLPDSGIQVDDTSLMNGWKKQEEERY